MTDIRYSWHQARVDGAEFVLSDEASLRPGFKLVGGLPHSAAVYRWGFYVSHRLAGAYIGETESLQKRVRGYLYPVPTQETNKRMNGEFRNAISRGETIKLETVEIAPMKLN